ncbi:hypothetical protein [Sphaerisporangium aureirubrum]|uniref:DUF3040 domain-containing protein n=1 Tax=Sphaerisporangium aureirubrum TaxID=1544736 RepID=A0ABW1NWI2_9ACTN
MSETPEQQSAAGTPMVRATPRDVVHIRLGSFAVFIALALSVLAFVAGFTVGGVVLVVLAVAAVVDVVLAVRRQRRLGGGSRSMT